VKGKAEKVALVPNDFPLEVLVSGTLYKMVLDESRVDTRYVLLYLLSKFGKAFRDRGKSNILVSYVNKDELYAVPIPIASPEFQASIAQDYVRAEARYRGAQTLYAEAETLLLDGLGLNDLNATHTITYERDFREVARVGRFDAEYFHTRYVGVIDAVKQHAHASLRDCATIYSGYAWKSEYFLESGEPGEPFVRIRDCKPGLIDGSNSPFHGAVVNQRHDTRKRKPLAGLA
jgi:type I restriction enzyme S subunit